MIKFADNDTKPLVWSMWKCVFGDTDEYMNLIFAEKYKNENTLIYFDNDKAVASLQMFPYTIRFYGKNITFYYLAGLCTLPEYRNKGYMRDLIMEAFRIMQSRDIALTILVPAEDWLFGYYQKYGYEKTFKRSEKHIDLDSIVKKYPLKIEEAFKLFDLSKQQNDFVVLKTKDDLQTILKEYIMDGKPMKYNLNAMARVIDAKPLLELYAKDNPLKTFTIQITDNQLNKKQTFKIENGFLIEMTVDKKADLEVNINVLTKLLFGYNTNELPKPYNSIFEEHQPIINLMLE